MIWPGVARVVLVASLVFGGLMHQGSPGWAQAGVDPCVGDCGNDGRVTVDELVTGVKIALDGATVSLCAPMDSNGDQRVTVDELVQAVNALLRGCQAPPTPTATHSPTATATLSPTLPLHTQTPTATVDPPTPTATATGSPSVLALLKQGGYVIHWRHSTATVCADCTAAGKADNPLIPDWWKSCEAVCPPSLDECTTAGLATARQLDANGVAQATAIGEFFAQQSIPVGRVLSSEYCRCVGTAELMALGPAIEQRSDITFAVYDEANRCANATALLAEVPAAGTNTAIIGHAGFLGLCGTIGDLAMSEAAIFKPDGQGGSTLVTRVLWNAWETLP